MINLPVPTDTPATEDATSPALPDNATGVPIVRRRTKRDRMLAFLADYEGIWHRAHEHGGILIKATERQPLTEGQFTQRMYYARRILTKDVSLRRLLPPELNLKLYCIVAAENDCLYVGPKQRVYTARAGKATFRLRGQPIPDVREDERVLPPSKLILYDDRQTYLAMMERAMCDPLYLPEANLVIQCTTLADCGRVMADLRKVRAGGSVVDEERNLVLVIAEEATFNSMTP